MKPNITQSILGVLLAALVTWGMMGQVGCESLGQLQDQSARATATVNAVDTEIDKLRSEKYGLEASLGFAEGELESVRYNHDIEQAKLQEQLAQAENKLEIQALIDAREATMLKSEAIFAKMTKKLDELTGKLDEKMVAKDEAVAVVNRVNDAIQGATNPAEAVGAIATAAAPLVGPYAPLIMLGGSLLSALLGGAYKGKKVAEHIAVPIEKARNKELEKKLNAESEVHGPNYIVFDKRAVGAAHGSNGVGKLISAATAA